MFRYQLVDVTDFATFVVQTLESVLQDTVNGHQLEAYNKYMYVRLCRALFSVDEIHRSRRRLDSEVHGYALI